MMVQTAFLSVLGMSMAANLVILAVILARLPLKKAPKVFSYALWAVVLFRLLCPFSVESALSVIPEQTREIPQLIALQEYEHVTVRNAVDAAQRAIGDVLNDGIGSVSVRLDSQEAGHNGIVFAWNYQVWLLFFGYLWPVGIAAMVIYSAVSYLKLRRKLIGAVPLHDNVYLADNITSPFVMGLLRPKIYLPSSLPEGEREYIILHEQHHIRRLDHIVKALAFLALCIHWFNPLVWAAFILSGRDMEMSCDEAVVKKVGEGIRADYSASLLSLATGRRIIAGTPLAFGEGDTGGRIKNLAKWKKPALWVIAAAVAVVVLVAIVCGTNSQKKADLEVTPLDNGVELTCHFKEPIRSWAICADVYLEGKLVSSDPVMFDTFHEEDGSFSRRRMMQIVFERGFAGTLQFAYIFEEGGRAEMKLDLPRDRYTAAAYMPVEMEGNLEPDGDVVLYNVILSNQADGKIFCTDDIITANDTVVQYRLATSTEGIEGWSGLEKFLK